ncbi:MAG: DUF4340 domain-containing protein [Anaerolineales bacterium]
MIRRTTWIVLGAFIGLLGIYLLWSSQGQPLADGEPTATPAPLWQVAPDQIRSILVEDLVSGRRVAAQREPEVGWKVTEPADAVQDVSRTERAATWLQAPVPRSDLGEQPDLEPFGLVNPSYRVSVTLVGGTELVLEVGGNTPTGSSQYVRFAGRSGVLVFTKSGLEEALGLLIELIPTPTPTITATSTEVPTAQVTETSTPEATTPGPTSTP